MTRLVIADDHAFIRAGVLAVLSASGFEVVASVEDGLAALAAISEHDPDVVVLDASMPNMGGVEVLTEMRAQGDQRAVVLLTAELDDERLLSALRAKVNGIVFKDGAEDRLSECITAVAKGRDYIDRELLERAVGLWSRPIPAEPLSELAPRERDVARLVAQGLRNREIADHLSMSEGTVKVYLHTIYGKLGMENRTALALMVAATRPTSP